LPYRGTVEVKAVLAEQKRGHWKLATIAEAYLCPPSPGLLDCFRLVSPPFIVEVVFAPGLPPALACVEVVMTLLPEVPLVAGAAEGVEVMVENVVDFAS